MHNWFYDICSSVFVTSLCDWLIHVYNGAEGAKHAGGILCTAMGYFPRSVFVSLITKINTGRITTFIKQKKFHTTLVIKLEICWRTTFKLNLPPSTSTGHRYLLTYVIVMFPWIVVLTQNICLFFVTTSNFQWKIYNSSKFNIIHLIHLQIPYIFVVDC